MSCDIGVEIDVVAELIGCVDVECAMVLVDGRVVVGALAVVVKLHEIGHYYQRY